MTAKTNDVNNRIDLTVISNLVTKGARVLDIGCNDGALLKMLEERKNVDGRGIELSQKGVNQCVALGLSVIQGDADYDLVHYPDDSFDFVILSQTIQATRNTKTVLEELLRIGKHCIVSAPNFGHWRMRGQLLFQGRMPITKSLPYSWYDTPNIHFCTFNDLQDLCHEVGANIKETHVLSDKGTNITKTVPKGLWNLLAQQSVFLLSRT